jgi:hypothetical protein
MHYAIALAQRRARSARRRSERERKRVHVPSRKRGYIRQYLIELPIIAIRIRALPYTTEFFKPTPPRKRMMWIARV